MVSYSSGVFCLLSLRLFVVDGESEDSVQDISAEKVLDELYGKVWREKRKQVLTPKTAPKPYKNVVGKENRLPKTEV